MRDILFRGISIENGKFVEGYYIKERVLGKVRTTVVHTITPPLMANDPYCLEKIIIKPATLGQYIGLRDKKRTKDYPEGQRVFEGDVVRCQEDESLPEFVGVIEYEKLDAAWWVHNRNKEEAFYLYDAGRDFEIEVIGSIHTNPELIK